MQKLRAAVLVTACLATIAIAPSALAHSETHPGFYGDMIASPPAEADYGTGFTSTERMIERCVALEKSVVENKQGEVVKYAKNAQSAYCLGWINSAMAYLNFHNEAGKHTLGVCMPETTNSNDVLKLFLDYVYKHKEDTKYNASLLIYWALLDNFPCEEQKN
jgi:hypothetical protein